MVSFESLREFISHLRQRGELVTVKKPVSARHEIGALLKLLERRAAPAVLFENIKDSQFPVLGAVYSSRDRVAAALGTDARGYAQEASRRTRNLIEPEITTSAQPPCQEVVLKDDQADLSRLPILWHHEKDGGPYITAGVILAEDKAKGYINCSINRIQVVGKKHCRIHLSPGFDLYDIQRRAEASGEALGVAVALGAPPALLYAAVASLAPGQSELALAGGFLGRPLALSRCLTVDSPAPSHCEMVIEGIIPAQIREVEGPFADGTDHYTKNVNSHVLEITAITHRKDAIYQAVTAGAPYSECNNLQWVGRQYRIWEYVQNYARDVRAVNMTVGGTGSINVAVALRPTARGEVRSVIAALFALPYIKNVFVVDEDVDVFDPNDVEWAITSRVQADRDVVILSDAQGIPIDPSIYKSGLLTAKLGIDATHKRKPEEEERVKAHPDYVKKIMENWEEYFPEGIGRSVN